jgi:hypothetical protein
VTKELADEFNEPAMMVVIRRVFVWVVFTSLRLLLLGVQRDVSATILLRTGNYTFTPIPDVAADFGLPVR